MRVKVLFIILITIFGCKSNSSNNNQGKINSQEDSIADKEQSITLLEGTIWERYIAEGCIDFYKFIGKDSVVIFYCEPGDKIFAHYQFKDDTIRIQTLKGEFDDEFPHNSSHRHKKRAYKMVYMKDSLGYSADAPEKFFRVK